MRYHHLNLLLSALSPEGLAAVMGQKRSCWKSLSIAHSDFEALANFALAKSRVLSYS